MAMTTLYHTTTIERPRASCAVAFVIIRPSTSPGSAVTIGLSFGTMAGPYLGLWQEPHEGSLRQVVERLHQLFLGTPTSRVAIVLRRLQLSIATSLQAVMRPLLGCILPREIECTMCSHSSVAFCTARSRTASAYVLIDPRTGLPFYVGMTKARTRRYNRHCP